MAGENSMVGPARRVSSPGMANKIIVEPVKSDQRISQTVVVDPWWGKFPDILWKCSLVVISPIRFALFIADAVVSLTFVALIGAIGLWYFGYIPDALIAKYVGDLGNRIISILNATGVL